MMAGVVADLGDVNQAFEMWQKSLVLHEQIGNVKGRAVALHEMAGLIAQQGDAKRSLELWRQSLVLYEQIEDVRGKAATLHNMGWLAGKQGDFEEERRLYLEAAKLLSAVRAWLDLVTALNNLGSGDNDDALVFLAQALWLVLRVEVPVKMSLDLTAAVLGKIGVEHYIAPWLGTVAMFIAQIRGQNHPEQEKIFQSAIDLLGICAEARNIKGQDQVEQWIVNEGLNDPKHFLPPLNEALEAMVGEGKWLFDHRLVKAPWVFGEA
jgi:tetratricopeptide (TPR) repeat protein